MEWTALVQQLREDEISLLRGELRMLALAGCFLSHPGDKPAGSSSSSLESGRLRELRGRITMTNYKLMFVPDLEASFGVLELGA